MSRAPAASPGRSRSGPVAPTAWRPPRLPPPRMPVRC